MTKILPIGSLLTVDKHGFLINESSVDNIISPWKEACEEAKSIYRRHLGDAVHSIYVRGSVPRGMAIHRISDLDTFAVIFAQANDIDFSAMENEMEQFQQKYDFLSGLDAQVFFYEDILNDSDCINERFVIKTLSACLYGDDLAQKIVPFKADRSLAQHQSKNLPIAVDNVKKAMSITAPNDYIRDCCQWIMKRIVRTGFVLVMEKEQAFTRDLYTSCQIFSKYYPEQQNNMNHALELAINPSEHPAEINHFIDDFGAWLQNELKQQLWPKSNGINS